MFRNPKNVFVLLVILFIGLVLIDLPERYQLNFTAGPIKIHREINPPQINFRVFGFQIKKAISTHLGLDLAGGTSLTLVADMRDIKEADRVGALDSARGVIERRVNFFGLTEPVVQSVYSKDNYKITVELPGISDVESALSILGQTAKLEFREFSDAAVASGSGFIVPTLQNTKSVGLSGKDLQKAQLTYSSQTGEPEVAIQFAESGAKKFADITARLVGRELAIFLDDLPLTWPRVQTTIADGQAVITGSFTRDQARDLALQLNAGALPVPVTVAEKRTVEATLGSQSVFQSIRAGAIGLALVAVFMILKYGWLGLLADMALLLYGLLNLALYRLIPVTLTLPGITGFILSIGMAVDSNILIFERYREEYRSGKPWKIAMELGFGKAWDSIRDANITTLITCMILFNPLNWQALPSSGMVRGFAITLFIGVVTSLFTGIVVSRTLIRVLYKEKNKI